MPTVRILWKRFKILILAPILYLQQDLSSCLSVGERGGIIVLIQDCDESGARRAAWGGSTVLSHHDELVAGLKLTIKRESRTYLPLKMMRQTDGAMGRETERERVKKLYCREQENRLGQPLA